jgi:hypothetical protein
MKILKTNLDFVAYLKEVATKNTVYMWGEFGRLVTSNTIREKKVQYPDHYDNERVSYFESLINKNYYAYDCAGLIKSYWMSNYGESDVKYLPRYDLDAYGITVGNASLKGDVKDIPNIPGLLLYMEGHCGVYIGDGKVIECTSNERISGIKYGKVCYSNINDRAWLYYTKSRWLNYLTTDENNTSQNNDYFEYSILNGDTLTSISKKYNVSINDLVSINNIKNPNLIFAGSILKIPNQNYYIVKSGDTLSSIAKKYNTTWQNLYELNKDSIKDPNLIYVNQQLKIK